MSCLFCTNVVTDIMDLLNISKIILMEIDECLKNSKLAYGSICIKTLCDMIMDEFGSEDSIEVMKSFLENPRGSFEKMVRALGGFESSAKALIICIVEELVERYLPNFDALIIVRAVMAGDRDTLLSCVEKLAEKIVEARKGSFCENGVKLVDSS